jgi:hypothetical protein
VVGAGVVGTTGIVVGVVGTTGIVVGVVGGGVVGGADVLCTTGIVVGTGIVGTTGDVAGAEDLGAVACVVLDPLLGGRTPVEDAAALEAAAAGCVCFAIVFAFLAEEAACDGATVVVGDALPAGVPF